MNEDIQKMLRMAEMIRDATQVGENTAVRVGTEIYDIVVELSRMLDMMDEKLENDAVVRIIKSELAKITITDAQIADGAITAAKLADGSVKNRHLASNCVTSDKLQPGAVKHDHLTEDCISTGNIRDGSVTAKKTRHGHLQGYRKQSDRHRDEGLPSSNHGGTDNRYY